MDRTGTAQGERSADEAPSVRVPLSAGEFVDRLAIVELKAQRLPGENRERAAALVADWQHLVAQLPAGVVDSEPADELRAVHATLWDAENEIRAAIDVGDDGPIAAVARRIAATNELRAEIKRRIDDLAGSEATDWKFYGG